MLVNLYGSGDRVLMAKMCNGGVVHLDYKLPGLSNRFTKIIQTFKLSSFSLKCDHESITRISELLIGMKPSLRHLAVLHADSSQLMRHPSAIFYDPRLPLIGCLTGPWIVSSTFPQLESLNLSSHAFNGSSDAAIVALFCKGLPKTLTTLTLPRNNALSVDIWKLLPPGLTSVGGIKSCLPVESHLPALDAITHLDCSITLHSTFEAEENRYRPDGFSKPTTLSGWEPHLKRLALPRNLVSLNLDVPLKLLAPDYVMPSSITSVTWTFGYDDEIPLNTLLRMFPATITALELKSLDLEAENESQLAELPILDKLVDFKLNHCSISSGDVDAQSDLLLGLLNSVSSAKRISLELDAETGITLAHLERCKFPNLRTLGASFHATCFLEGVNGYPLHNYLPDLDELVIHSVLEEFDDQFSFAAVPPSLSHLKITTCTVGTQTLHLLSPNTKLSALFLLLQAAPNFQSLVFPPSRTPPLAYCPRSATSLASELSLERLSFCPSPHIEVEPVEFLMSNGSVGKRHMIHFFEDKAGRYDKTALRWTSATPLPPSLTALKIPKSMTGIIDMYLVTPSALPNLVELNIRSHAFPHNDEYDFGGFQSLKSLFLDSIKASSQSTCPPNLTRLRTNGDLNLPPSFLPLPQSLTEVGCATFSPATALKPLLNLHTVLFSGRIDLATLPASITHIDLNLLARADELILELESLPSLFPGLKRVSLVRNVLSQESIDRLESAYPADISLGLSNVNSIITRCDLLAARLGCAPGSIILDDVRALLRWANNALHRAYRSRPRSSWPCNTVSFDADSFARFADFLSSDTTHLFFSAVRFDGSNWTAVLPRGLTYLKVVNIRTGFGVSYAGDLPATLQTLILDGFLMDSATISLLPRGLTHLDAYLSAWTEAPVWPPALTKLCSSKVHGLQSAFFNILPPTLEILALHALAPSVEDLRSLPDGLKIFEFRKDSPNFGELLAVAEERGITLLSTSESANEIQRSKYLSAVLADKDDPAE